MYGQQGYDFMIVYGGYPLFTCFVLQRFIVCSLYFRVRCDHTLHFGCHCILFVPLLMIKGIVTTYIVCVIYPRLVHYRDHNRDLS